MGKGLEFAVLGDPVGHSLSPVIHSAALASAGLDGRYLAIRADSALLLTTVASLRTGRVSGINVTMPLKVEAFEACDRLTREAKASGTVNTLRLRDGLVEGHSTDTVSIARFLNDLDPSGTSPIYVLGSGGAAAAALAGRSGRPGYLSGRSRDKTASLTRKYPGVETIPWGTPVAGGILVNATPLGMHEESLPADIVAVSGSIIDLPYGSKPTPTVRIASQHGIPVVDGVEFLVDQACVSFEWWTGVAPLRQELMNAAQKGLKSQALEAEMEA